MPERDDPTLTAPVDRWGVLACVPPAGRPDPQRDLLVAFDLLARRANFLHDEITNEGLYDERS